MRSITLPLPLLGFVVATRAALGAGLGLLLAERLSPERRRALGVVLVGIGTATTIPAVRLLRRRLRVDEPGAIRREARFVGATRFPRKGDEPF